jgi:protein-S-isoprenylcysteine O-methyltransferase Ste14
MMGGFFLAFWGTPAMTAGHLLLAAGMSAYILIALHYEERDLVSLFGPKYEDYRSRVGMLIPRFRSSGGRSKIRT